MDAVLGESAGTRLGRAGDGTHSWFVSDAVPAGLVLAFIVVVGIRDERLA
ncbi:hypothetical protein ACFVY1_40295 [Streptomyces sp. NPDC058293]|jgi:hypothetical protein|uniref:MFS transporter n=1 Tax=Streptomyces sp. NBC_00119 TaxID=2975659 RepID=A0AAU1U0M0_9ACTN|nr:MULTISPECIES: hypothetical protein [unclassified Streptomyces]MCX4648447.1 hypothetical protein [Streptomyces sp. NBC_01446]MCX5323436.1 hypothetical protein [Streptomyces sp. NBC_00120]